MTCSVLLLFSSIGLSLAQLSEQAPEASDSGSSGYLPPVQSGAASSSSSFGYMPPIQSGAAPSRDFSSYPAGGSMSGGGWTRPSWPNQNSYGSTQYMGPDIQILPDNAASMTKPWAQAPLTSGQISSMTRPWTPYSSGPISSMTKPWTPYNSGAMSSMTKPWSPQYQPSYKSSYQYPTAIRYPSTGGGCSQTKPQAGGCSSRLTAPVYSRPPVWGSSSPCGSSPSTSPCGSSGRCGTGSYGPIIDSLKPCSGSGRNPGTGGSGWNPGTGGSGWNPGTGGSGWNPGTGGSGWNPGTTGGGSWTSGLSWQKPVVSTNYITRGTKVQSSGASSDCGSCGK